MIPVRVWILVGLLVSAAIAGGAASHHYVQGVLSASRAETKAAQAEAKGWQIKYELCSASVSQLGAAETDAHAKLASARAALASAEPARAAHTVTVIRRIQEAPTCNAALRSAWQSAPQ